MYFISTIHQCNNSMVVCKYLTFERKNALLVFFFENQSYHQGAVFRFLFGIATHSLCLSNQEEAHLPYEFTHQGFIQRVNAYVDKQVFKSNNNNNNGFYYMAD